MSHLTMKCLPNVGFVLGSRHAQIRKWCPLMRRRRRLRRLSRRGLGQIFLGVLLKSWRGLLHQPWKSLLEDARYSKRATNYNPIMNSPTHKNTMYHPLDIGLAKPNCTQKAPCPPTLIGPCCCYKTSTETHTSTFVNTHKGLPWSRCSYLNIWYDLSL